MTHFEPTGKFQLTQEPQLIVAQFEGEFNYEGALAYCDALKNQANALTGQPWAFIGDINKLDISTIDAIEEIQKLILWMNEHGCVCMVNVADHLSNAMDYQIQIAKGENTIFEAKSYDHALEICRHALAQAA